MDSTAKVAQRRYIIVGPAQAGKTLYGRYLAHAIRAQSIDTSDAVVELERVRRVRLQNQGKLMPEWTWDPKRGRASRVNLVALGEAAKACFGQTFWADRAFARGRICVGVRAQKELTAVKQKYPEAVVVYVAREGAGDKADTAFDLVPSCGDYVVQNSGTKQALADSAHALACVYDEFEPRRFYTQESVDWHVARVRRAFGDLHKACKNAVLSDAVLREYRKGLERLSEVIL